VSIAFTHAFPDDRAGQGPGHVLELSAKLAVRIHAADIAESAATSSKSSSTT